MSTEIVEPPAGPADPNIHSIPRVHTVLQPASGWAALNLRDMWEFRDLLFFLTWRDITVRYKQTVLGASWAVLQPVFTMIVFSIFFGHLAKISSDGVPYPVFSYCALVPWTYFAYALGESSNSLVGNERLISKVYFPRLVIPFAATLGGLVDFGIAFVVLLGMMLFFHIVPSPAILLLPAFLLLAIATALAVGLWLSALNVRYRDVRYTIPFLIQVWLFATPVAYPSSLVHGFWLTIYGLNPMAGVVEGFRWALLGTVPPGSTLIVSVITVLLLLFGGLKYFRRMERTFADVI